MKFKKTKIKGVYIIKNNPFSDARGSFTRLFCKEEIKKKKVIEIMENLSNLWPSLVPTGIIDGDAKIIYDAVAEINLI